MSLDSSRGIKFTFGKIPLRKEWTPLFLFNGISAFMSYLIPKPSLLKVISGTSTSTVLQDGLNPSTAIKQRNQNHLIYDDIKVVTKSDWKKY